MPLSYVKGKHEEIVTTILRYYTRELADKPAQPDAAK